MAVVNSHKYCDGIRRRDMLSIGSMGLFGSMINLPRVMEAQARAAAEGKPAKDISMILVFLHGGLSTIDTWDMKPDAPAEFRGEFDPKSTSVPGIQLCEHLPSLAQQHDKFSVVRSFGHSNSDHGPADHYLLTGYHPVAGFNAGLNPNNQKPCMGSIVARELGPRGSVPPYVSIPKVHNSAGSSYLGAAYSPFGVLADPSAPDFAVPDLAPPVTVDGKQLNNRRALLSKLNRFEKAAEVTANQSDKALNTFQRNAFEVMTSDATKAAFDISQEPEKLRDEYGRHTLGQSCLMARRLVEAGVRFVFVDHNNWDTHYNNFHVLKNDLLPHLDSGMSTLLRDLDDRGMLDTTLVLVTGEFGRTPRINGSAGRDHWGPSSAIAMAGGGVHGGRIIGASNERAERPATTPYGPADLVATVYHAMGIDPATEYETPEGRPVPVVPGEGRVIDGLF